MAYYSNMYPCCAPLGGLEYCDCDTDELRVDTTGCCGLGGVCEDCVVVAGCCSCGASSCHLALQSLAGQDSETPCSSICERKGKRLA